MSYEPTNWKTGDVVTSQKLNKMESGIAGAGGLFVVHGSYNEQDDNSVLDCTAQELLDAIDDGKIIICSSIIKKNGVVVFACQGTMTNFMYTPGAGTRQLSRPETYYFDFVADVTGIQKDDIEMGIPKVYGYVAHSLDEYPVMEGSQTSTPS